ncbi:MAG: succinate dehydrogenase iron-sulfur subunit [Chlamydiae bacterium]|nr:succinate dehydrogenase iron-sulfur subunit [Chlamydiota bacterium]
MADTFIVKILRGIPGSQYFEEFILEETPFLNVTSCLLKIQQNPINRQGQHVCPVVWEQGCLEEVCGSCSILINGKPRQGCTALISEICEETGSRTIVLAPMTKFPLIRDLIVDRDSMFSSLTKVHAWVDVDDSRDQGIGPSVAPEIQKIRYELSTCMTCGCCLEACPQVNARTKFLGAAAISQVRLFNLDPTGKLQATERLRTLMQEGGISDCGNAQNCVEVCPKQIPLTESLTLLARQVTTQVVKDFFSVSDA